MPDRFCWGVRGRGSRTLLNFGAACRMHGRRRTYPARRLRMCGHARTTVVPIQRESGESPHQSFWRSPKMYLRPVSEFVGRRNRGQAD